MPKTVLLLENDLEIKKILEQKLKNEGYHVLCPVDSYVALECAQDRQIDLIILNHQMPIINGKNTISLLEDQQKQRPAIVFLSKTTSAEDYTCFDNCHCVYKPFVLDTLMHKINTLLNTQ